MSSATAQVQGRDLIPASFCLRRLALAMLSNTANTLTFFDEKGAEVVKRQPEIVAEVQGVIRHLRQLGLSVGLGQAAVIAGASDYSWLLAALCCFFTGVEVIALPETLKPEEVA